MNYLVDSGFLYSSINKAEQSHPTVARVASSLTGRMLLPVPAIAEVAYLLRRDLGAAAVANFIGQLPQTGLILENPLAEDYQRAAEIMRQYADARLDFVDTIIVALAERLNITHILTLDQRDFRLVRPRHCAAFELLP